MKTKFKPSIRTIYHALNLTACIGLGLLVSVSVQAQNLFVTGLRDGNIYEFTPNGGKSIFATDRLTELSDNLPIAFNRSGDLFVSDVSNIFEYTPTGLRSSFAVSQAGFFGVLAFNSTGDLFATSESELYGQRIYQFTSSGVPSIFASGAPWSFGPGMAFDSAGDLFVNYQNGVEQFTHNDYGLEGTVVSGSDVWGGLAFNSVGDLFVAQGYDGFGSIIEITPAGTESTFATGLDQPVGLAFNNAGDLFVADTGSGNIYEYSPTGTRRTFASGLKSPEWLAFQPVPEPSVLGLLAASITALFIPRPRRRLANSVRIPQKAITLTEA